MAYSKLSKPPLSDNKLLEEGVCPEPDGNKPRVGWRYLPDTDGDVMIVSSYGDVYPSEIKVAKKLAHTTDRLTLARQELDCLQDLYKQRNQRRVVYCYCDHGNLQMSKDYYLGRMEKFIMETDREMAFIFFAGDSEMSTGNWCFKDGVITFQDIYNLYTKHFSGKRLTIISDCSYSGNWVRECAKLYDKEGILPCGHHSRERGLLINVFASCQSHQEATILACVTEGMEFVGKDILLRGNKTLSSGQTIANGNFQRIRCKHKHKEQCEYTNTHTISWQDETLPKLIDYGENNLCLLRGTSQHKPAWWYVLVDNDKLQQFKDKYRTSTAPLSDYGRVLHSGWGMWPPSDIEKNINHHYGIKQHYF